MTSETADVVRSGWFMILPPAFCLFGQPVEIGHALEQTIERVSNQLLRRPSVDGTGEPEPKMPFRIQTKRKRGLALASRQSARTRSAAPGRSRYDDRCSDLRHDRRFFDLYRDRSFVRFELIELGRLVDLALFRILFAFVEAL